MTKGKVYWITGLSGAGKTTVGKILYERICAKKPNVFFLDSDAGRIVFNDKYGYSREGSLYGCRNARVCTRALM
ncbi:adenylyl-sulfate kinase [Selenomonas sp. AB3002]|uniref:adenylyl-sulfate kinase n=1 Tax=Selenomonas sp. AB3002 TaxID=1392502 RepID=UPI0004969D75